jgi:hypothetical protein
MAMKKLWAGLGSLALAASLIVGAPAASADAAWGNRIENQSNRCTTYTLEGYSDAYRETICGNGNYAYNVKYIVLAKGQCAFIGYWTFTYYCAPSYVSRFVYIGSGWHYVR